ncbi:unnamed protein product [Meganyctiphanes norvegica]|uniref:Broad-complex n=1 Tax=Meganyctiphanes norvegica TaxID=48144 RepID=A0AAV2PTJ2_MEGNR
MDEGILSLRWNNHRSTFFHILSTLHQKELYSDVTIACEGKFFPVHKLVLSVCSEYFEDMFKKTNCKHPIIVLKDILCDELEALLNYMYVGEANVAQSDLARLIKAAECLRIKGLAVPDENPESNESKRPNSSVGKEDSSASKRRRQEETHNKVPPTSREGHNDERCFTEGETSNSRQSTPNAPSRNSSASPNQNQRLQIQERRSNSSQGSHVVAEVVLDDEPPVVKTEPKIEEDIILESESLTYESEKQGGGGSGRSQTYEAQLLNQAPQNVLQDIMAQGIPSGTTESIPSWENSGNNMSGGGGGFTLDGFSTDDSSRASQQLDVIGSYGSGTYIASGGVRSTSGGGGCGGMACPFCGKILPYQSEYQRHLRKHTGERPFLCHFCNYASTRKSHLKTHMIKVHADRVSEFMAVGEPHPSQAELHQASQTSQPIYSENRGNESEVAEVFQPVIAQEREGNNVVASGSSSSSLQSHRVSTVVAHREANEHEPTNLIQDTHTIMLGQYHSSRTREISQSMTELQQSSQQSKENPTVYRDPRGNETDIFQPGIVQ